jgi:hypothetical protein
VARIVAERMTDFTALPAAIATERGLLMSRRHEIQFTPDEQAAFLSQPHKAALATIDKEGFPHVVAMGYRYMGEHENSALHIPDGSVGDNRVVHAAAPNLGCRACNEGRSVA